ncbi:glycosyltransferase family 4 protein [Actinoplanes sp. NPDC049599]|uniref:glycosyltransferase family 4 protein n=1 Tax=Actinoplanes sp. NPDC049599 TaxID=3363903 RepID=UPI00379FF953
MSRIRIAVLNWRDCAHPRAGGAELYCERVAAELVEQGVAVTYLTARVPGRPSTEEHDGFRLVRRGGTLTVYGAALIWLWRHRGDIDGVIDSQNGIPFFSPLVLGRKVPVVLLIHHVHQRQFRQYFPWPVSGVGRWLERRGTALVYRRRPIVTVSPSSRHAIRRELGLKGPVFITPCGTDLPAGAAVARAPSPRIVLVTRLVPHKRVELVLDAVAEARQSVPGLELHLVGDGPSRAAVTREIERRGLADCAVVHGRLDEAQKWSLLRTAWLTVSASAGEGWGLSLVEAGALGVPVVALRVPGVQDAVRDGRTGLLVDDEAHLAQAIADLAERLRDEAEAERWRARARAWAAGFHWWRTAQQIRRVLEADARHVPAARDRRTAGDVSTVLELTGAVPDLPRLRGLTRRTDSWSREGDTVVGLLHGADEIDALTVVRRLGLSSRPDIRIRLRLARPYDLLRYA